MCTALGLVGDKVMGGKAPVAGLLPALMNRKKKDGGAPSADKGALAAVAPAGTLLK